MSHLKRTGFHLAILLVMAACHSTRRDQVVAISGPLCTSALASGESNHCYKAPSCALLADPARCTEYALDAYTDTSGTLGTVYWKGWWIKPSNRSDAQLAGRVPLMFAHGMTMNMGYTETVLGMASLADLTTRPVMMTAEIVPAVGAGGYGVGYTSNSVTLNGAGPPTHATDMAITGANTTAWTWEGAYGRRDCLTVPREQPTYATGYRPDGKNPVFVCAKYKVIRSGNVYTRTAEWTMQELHKQLVLGGKLPGTQKFDIFGHSAGPLYTAAALANHNGLVAGPADSYFTGFASLVRNVISLNGANLGVIDGALNDMYAQSSGTNSGAARKSFITTWNTATSPVNKPRWYALVTQSCARQEPGVNGLSGNDVLGNYMFGQVYDSSLKDIPNYNGRKDWGGDGVVPTDAQGSPWSNSSGVLYTTASGKPARFYRRVVYDCGTKKTVTDQNNVTTTTYGTQNYLKEPGVFGWKGSHRWTLTDDSGEAWGEWLPVLEAACLASGATCKYESECYGGPAGTRNVGRCRAGHKFSNESSGTCWGQVLPGTEVCNGVDDDCDGSADENGSVALYRDADRDGFGISSSTTQLGCAGYVYDGWSTSNTDCRDTDPYANPGTQPGAYQYRSLGGQMTSTSWDFNCDGINEPYCGDGKCNGPESVDSCNVDCPGSVFWASYSASNTSSATQNTPSQTLYMNAGDNFTVGVCASGTSYTGDTFFRLMDWSLSTTLVTSDDACGLGSQLGWTASSGGNVILRRGCYGSGACSGNLRWVVSSGYRPSGY